MNTNKPKSLFLFYLLVVYIFFQFVWWSYMLFQLNNKVYAGTDELHKRWLMIFGEGIVFMWLLTYGVVKIRSYLKKESEVAIQQKNFMLAVTHELKSPLASIKLILETIQKRTLDKNKLDEITSDGISDAQRLNNLVENILFVANIENSSAALNREDVNLSDYLNEVIKKAAFIYGQSHKLVADIIPDIFYAIDKINFQSVIYNLIENAVKYSAKGSSVFIKLYLSDVKIILSVTDEGIGIAEPEKQKIFEKFYRSGNEETRTSKGTGLGLYIVKKITELHAGIITVKNNLPQGSAFEIAFPHHLLY